MIEAAQRDADDASGYLDDAYTDLELAREELGSAADQQQIDVIKRRISAAVVEVGERLAAEQETNLLLQKLAGEN